MTDVPRLLWGSLLLRPYVFAFLVLHLAGASRLLGWRRTAAFTLITWGVALGAEHSSIRTGIPFGWYFYLPKTAEQELWIAGVPFFDSLSFAFLLVASYGLAWFLLSGDRSSDRGACEIQAKPGEAAMRPPRMRHLVLTSLLFVLIDMVIDPVALRGERWFLGQIYGYPEPGAYFGVPLANFLGWAVVGATATALYHVWERRRAWALAVDFGGRAALCPGLYFIVLMFNLTVTFALREWWLGLFGILLTLPILLWTFAILVKPRALAWRPRAEGTRA
jgi:putative membrane protein